MNDLKPCPFCGGENVKTSHKDTFSGDFRRGVYCADCCGGIYPYYDIEAEAIAAWNTRAATTDSEFARAVHDGNLWRRVKGHIRCRNCGLNIESVIALDGCNKHAIKHCPNCGRKVKR